MLYYTGRCWFRRVDLRGRNEEVAGRRKRSGGMVLYIADIEFLVMLKHRLAFTW
jgi:hypothetical protein